jgi:hypothetical protein
MNLVEEANGFVLIFRINASDSIYRPRGGTEAGDAVMRGAIG